MRPVCAEVGAARGGRAEKKKKKCKLQGQIQQTSKKLQKQRAAVSGLLQISPKTTHTKLNALKRELKEGEESRPAWPDRALSPACHLGPNAVKKAWKEQESHFWYSKAPFTRQCQQICTCFLPQRFTFFCTIIVAGSILINTQKTQNIHFFTNKSTFC